MATFSVWVRTTVLYMAFSIFWNGAPCPPLRGLKPPQKTPIFKHFLIQLECWNCGCGLRPPFCIRIFRFFEIEPLCSPWDPQKEFCPPPPKVKFFIYWPILIKFDFFLGRGGEGRRGGERGTLYHKFLSQLLLVNIWKCYVSNFIKIGQ